jgi:hypothetical protein
MDEGSVRSHPVTARAAGLALGGLAAAAVAWTLRPATAAAGPVDGIVVGCAWLAWLCAGWLALGVAGCAAVRLCGRRVAPRGSAIIERCVPRRLSRLVDAVVTAGLVGAMLGGAATPAWGVSPASAVSAASHPAPRADPLEWPGLTTRHPLPSPRPPVRVRPPGRVRRPARAPRVGLVSAAPTRAAERHRVVTVRTGDSLWSIAAAHLGHDASAAAIATAWPRWYAENRHVIGNDPSLIRPGQRLRPPDPPATDRASAHRAGSSR